MNGDACLNKRDRRQFRVCSLLFVGEAQHIVDTEECLQRMVNEKVVVFERRKLMEKVSKSKVMKVSKSDEYGVLLMQLSGEREWRS